MAHIKVEVTTTILAYWPFEEYQGRGVQRKHCLSRHHRHGGMEVKVFDVTWRQKRVIDWLETRTEDEPLARTGSMEYFPSVHRILDSPDLSNHEGKWLKDMDHVVNEFRAHGYVHGDLRPPNFIVVILIRAGRNGGNIPGSPTSSDFTGEESRWDIQITKEHDERFIEYTKQQRRSGVRIHEAPVVLQ